MTKHFYLFLLSLAAVMPLNAQNYAWAKHMGSTAADLSRSIAVDASGNVYTTGSFTGTVDFDPSAATANLTSAGSTTDIFVSKFDASGNYVWAKSMGGTGANGDEGYGIAVDASGNVYTTGYFSGTADFDPSAATANLAAVGVKDIFVSKLSASGTYVWAKSMGGAGDEAVGYGIAINGSNIYTTGSFTGVVDFNPSTSTANLTSVSGSVDIFVSELTAAAGAYGMAKSMGGTGADIGYGIAVDASNNIYTTGSFSGTADFNPSATTSNLTSAGLTDIFMSKLNSQGTYVVAKKMGGTGDDIGYGIALDASGNIYTTGSFSGTADFDPGSTTSNLTSAGLTDIFVSKLDVSTLYAWAKSMGGTGDDVGYDIDVDASSNIYTTGSFSGTVDFDPSAATANLTSAGVGDIFVSKLSSTGTYGWAKSMGGANGDIGDGIAVDASGNVYTTGKFAGTADFDPNSCTANLTSGGTNDIFVSKLSVSAGTPTNNWLGSTSANWSTAANWSCGVPTSTDSVVIPATANRPTLSSNQIIGDLTFSAANQITLGNFNLTVNTLTGGSSTAYVVTNGTGTLTIKAVPTTPATLFPVGVSTTSYDPVTIDPTTSADFSVRVKATASATDFSGSIGNFNKTAKRQWDITPTGTPGSSILTLTNGGTTYTPTTPAMGHYKADNTWEALTATYSSGTWTATTTTFSPFGVGDVDGFSTVLPVELLAFKATPLLSGNLLTWTTGSEVNNEGFQVERIMDNGQWASLGFVKAQGKASNYQFVDNAPLPTSYYRLRQMDNDGKETFSKVVSVSNKGNNKLKVYPNPVSNVLTIKTDSKDVFQILNLLGQSVLSGKAAQRIDVSALPQGAYFLKVGTEQVKFVKQ